MARFELDVAPDDITAGRNPRARFNFSNGWTASVVFRTGPNGMDATPASLAHWPTGSKGKTEIGETEASPEEVAAFLAMIAAFPPHAR